MEGAERMLDRVGREIGRKWVGVMEDKFNDELKSSTFYSTA
jgi:hypothetical protein